MEKRGKGITIKQEANENIMVKENDNMDENEGRTRKRNLT
jgi:hypothetical protein